MPRSVGPALHGGESVVTLDDDLNQGGVRRLLRFGTRVMSAGLAVLALAGVVGGLVSPSGADASENRDDDVTGPDWIGPDQRMDPARMPERIPAYGPRGEILEWIPAETFATLAPDQVREIPDLANMTPGERAQLYRELGPRYYDGTLVPGEFVVPSTGTPAPQPPG